MKEPYWNGSRSGQLLNLTYSANFFLVVNVAHHGIDRSAHFLIKPFQCDVCLHYNTKAKQPCIDSIYQLSLKSFSTVCWSSTWTKFQLLCGLQRVPQVHEMKHLMKVLGPHSQLFVHKCCLLKLAGSISKCAEMLPNEAALLLMITWPFPINLILKTGTHSE